MAPFSGHRATAGHPLLYDGSHRVTIGQAGFSGEWFIGRIDDVAVYEHALTADQVAAHYAAGIQP